MDKIKRYPLYQKLEKLPWYCNAILALSVFIFCITIGFAVGIIVQKEKFQNVKNTIIEEKIKEEKRIKNIIQNYTNSASPSTKKK